MLASQATVTVIAGDAGVDHHAVSRLEPGHLAADLLDHPGPVPTHYERKGVLHSWKTVDHEEIEMIEPHGANPDQDLIRAADSRSGNIPNREMLRPAELIEGEGFHCRGKIDGRGSGRQDSRDGGPGGLAVLRHRTHSRGPQPTKQSIRRSHCEGAQRPKESIGGDRVACGMQ